MRRWIWVAIALVAAAGCAAHHWSAAYAPACPAGTVATYCNGQATCLPGSAGARTCHAGEQ